LGALNGRKYELDARQRRNDLIQPADETGKFDYKDGDDEIQEKSDDRDRKDKNGDRRKDPPEFQFLAQKSDDRFNAERQDDADQKHRESVPRKIQKEGESDEYEDAPQRRPPYFQLLR
jgi:hypothetical protein